jgi:succinylglutamate desuccinylase
MKIAVVCCLHGTEPYGMEVIKRLPSHIPSFIGNKKALNKNRRFIENDLNRSFPGNKLGGYEDKQAYYLCKELKEFDYVIDLHSSSNNCPLFGIITNPNKYKIELAKKLGLKRLVIMNESIASGKALIDSVNCGISLEVGPHNRVKNVEEVLDLIYNLVEDKNYSENLEIYEVFKIVKKEKENILITNFEEVKEKQIIAKNSTGNQLAEKDFVAILVGEQAYKEILCLAAKKIKLIDLI